MVPRGPGGPTGAGRRRSRHAPGMRGDLAEVAQAAVSGATGRDGGSIAVDSVQLRLLILRPRDVGGVCPLLGPTVHHGPAACQVHGAQARGGHTWGCVDAAVGGRALQVGQPQQIRVHQVPRPEVLVIAVAGGVAGQRVAAGVAGAALIPNLEKRGTGLR